MLSKELEIAKNTAYLAGRIMLEYFDGEQENENKADGTEVTIADKKINSLVIEELSKHFNDGIIGEEESTADYGDGRLWFCDPIDGTKAFVVGLPTAAFSLGLVVDGQPILGVLYDPFLDKLYYGIKDQGSYCQDQKLSVSDNPLKDSFVVTTSRIDYIAKNPKYMEQLVEYGAKPTSTGSGSVYQAMLLSRGKLVGIIQPSSYAHDNAAAQVIVEEAGGEVTDILGNKLDYTKPFKNGMLMSNTVAHKQLLTCAKLLTV